MPVPDEAEETQSLMPGAAAQAPGRSRVGLAAAAALSSLALAGGAIWMREPASVAASSDAVVGLVEDDDVEPKLFCFAMVRVVGVEPDLMRAQYDNQAGIYSCDDWELYSNGGVVKVGANNTIKVNASVAAMGDFDKGTTTNSWLNTQIFISAWDLVLNSSKWWDADWTVKVDPDAVFFPSRLRTQLKADTKRGEDADPLLVGNCDRTWRPDEKAHLAMYGSLEIFSRNAIGTYKANKHKCYKNLPWKKWGEDLYMQTCMKMFGTKVLNKTSFLGDKRCYAAPCSDATKVAFHEFKNVDDFFKCWHESTDAEAAGVTFVGGDAWKQKGWSKYVHAEPGATFRVPQVVQPAAEQPQQPQQP